MKKVLMYCHNGSGNHGCEAIVKSTTHLLNKKGINDVRLISSKKSEDLIYGVNEKVHIYDEINSPKRYKLRFLLAYISQKLFNNYKLMNQLSYLYPYEDCGKDTVSLSIGGDNYCYGDNSKYIGFHNVSKKYGHKTVLWGCSVEPELMDDENVLSDLKSFDKIVVRETISFNAMKEHGLTNAVLYPDPAFTLSKDESFVNIPKKNTVGINVSPLITKYEEDNGLILKNYINLIQYILHNTNMNISLIPHVIWEGNDDREMLLLLKNHFDDNRITILEDCNCQQLKKHISKLRFLVAARTHASIAAYSNCIPTLVAGYSIKSKGIARDLFGTYEHYVVPVQHLNEENDLTKEFIWLMENENYIINHLQTIMPDYINKSSESVNEIIELMR